MATRSASDEQRLPGTLEDFELLTDLAISLSTSVAGAETTERHFDYASHLLTAVCLAADGILRTHPESGLAETARRRVWNPVATAALARVLMEACLNLHYFCVEDISTEERELRFLIADLHCARERLHMSDAIRATHARFDIGPPSPDVAMEIAAAVEEADHVRGILRRQLDEARDQLQRNPHFKSLPARTQKMWAEGVYRADRYRGKGFAADLSERAKKAAFMPSVCDADYRLLSSYVHSAPSAIDQISAVGSDPRGMKDLVISAIIRNCCAYLAVCVRWFLSLFPELLPLVTQEMCARIDVCTSYVIGPVWLPSGGATGGSL